VARADRGADERRGGGAERGDQEGDVAEVLDTAGGTVLDRIVDVHQLHHGEREDDRADGQHRDGRGQARALVQLEQGGADEARGGEGVGGGHAAFSNRVVISRNRCSSVACCGSRRETAMPASTNRRLSSAAAWTSKSETARTVPSSTTFSTAAYSPSTRRAR